MCAFSRAHTQHIYLYECLVSSSQWKTFISESPLDVERPWGFFHTNVPRGRGDVIPPVPALGLGSNVEDRTQAKWPKFLSLLVSHLQLTVDWADSCRWNSWGLRLVACAFISLHIRSMWETICDTQAGFWLNSKFWFKIPRVPPLSEQSPAPPPSPENWNLGRSWHFEFWLGREFPPPLPPKIEI